MIQLNDLRVGYGTRVVLDSVNLTFRPGEITAILGVNGSGKSTLIRTVMGLQPPLGGEILLDGRPLDKFTAQERGRRMTYLAQFRAVPNISVERMVLHGRFPHLSYPRRYSPEDHRQVRAAMERAGVLELEHRQLPQLSGGQRQRVYLAMALAQDTPCLFFDEPTTYLDVGRQLEVMDTARSLAEEGRCVVLSVHDLCLALRGAHRLVILDDGRVRASGTPEEIYRSGVLGEVFGVEVCRIMSGDGWRYYYG